MESSKHNVGFIVANGETVGVRLGFRYSSMHEVGIRQLAEKFGVDEMARYREDPVKAATISRADDFLIHSTRGNVSYLARTTSIVFAGQGGRPPVEEMLDRLLLLDQPLLPTETCPPNLRTAWGPSEFCVRLEYDTQRFLLKLKEAFTRLDIAIAYVRDRRLRGCRGLNIFIPSLTPDATAREIVGA